MLLPPGFGKDVRQLIRGPPGLSVTIPTVQIASAPPSPVTERKFGVSPRHGGEWHGPSPSSGSESQFQMQGMLFF